MDALLRDDLFNQIDTGSKGPVQNVGPVPAQCGGKGIAHAAIAARRGIGDTAGQKYLSQAMSLRRAFSRENQAVGM